MFSAEILGRFCGASRKMLYTFGSVRSVRKTTNVAFRIGAAQPQADCTDQPGSEQGSSPRPEWERCGEGRASGRKKLYHVG